MREEGGEEYEYEMDREMHWEAQAEWEREWEVEEIRGREGAATGGQEGGGSGRTGGDRGEEGTEGMTMVGEGRRSEDARGEGPRGEDQGETDAEGAAGMGEEEAGGFGVRDGMVERGEEREGREEEGGEREVAGLEEIGREEDAGGQEQGHRRSARGHARRDAARSEGAEAARREERESRRARAREGEERTESRATDRETGRAAAAARIVALARRDGRELVEELREVGGIGRIKERWRWSVSPTGEREQVVLFNHGQEGGQEDQEVRAVILESQYGRGLYYASAASKGRELSFYDGVQVTREEYVELDEFTGLRHTLEIGGGGRVVNGLRGGRLINGIHGVTGMQYANTSRGGAEANNADFTGTAMVRVSASGGVERGQPVLLPYDWSAAAWEEIDSKVVGVCAYEEKGGGQGLGDEGGTFVVELATALRKGGLAAQLIREARAGWGKGQGRTELQVHMGNRRARAYYERLGMRRCRWWEEGRADEGPRLQGDHGGSLYEPRAGFQMMQVGPEELEAQLARRGAARAPTAGVEYVRATGVRGLRDAGLLKGVRAMMARVYGGEEWYVNDEEGEGRVECLYEKKRKGERRVKFVVARLVDSDRWVATAAEAEETGTEAEVGVSGGPETPTTAEGAAAATPAAAAVVVVGEEQAGEGEGRGGAIAEGGGGGRADASGVGTGEDGRKRDREGGGDTMDQGGGKRRRGESSVKGGIKRKRGDG